MVSWAAWESWGTPWPASTGIHYILFMLFHIAHCRQREQRRGVRADLQPGLGDPGEPAAGGGQGHGGQPAEPRQHQAQECHGRGRYYAQIVL